MNRTHECSYLRLTVVSALVGLPAAALGAAVLAILNAGTLSAIGWLGVACVEAECILCFATFATNPVRFQMIDETIRGFGIFGQCREWAIRDLVLQREGANSLSRFTGTTAVLVPDGSTAFRVWKALLPGFSAIEKVLRSDLSREVASS